MSRLTSDRHKMKDQQSLDHKTVCDLDSWREDIISPLGRAATYEPASHDDGLLGEGNLLVDMRQSVPAGLLAGGW